MPLIFEASLVSWHETHRLAIVVLVSFTYVASRFTRISWQVKQPMATAVCTFLPLALSSWHSKHFAESAFLSRGTGLMSAKPPLTTTQVPNTTPAQSTPP